MSRDVGDWRTITYPGCVSYTQTVARNATVSHSDWRLGGMVYFITRDFTAVIVLGQRFIFPTVSSHQSEGLGEMVSFAVFRSITHLKTGGLEATGSPSDGNKA